MTAETIDLRQLGERIRRLRLERGLSQEEVARPAFTAPYISHLEHGKRRPSHEALTHIAERLGMTYEQLVTGRDPHADLRLEIEIQSAIAQIHAGDPRSALGRLEKARAEADKTRNPRALLRADEGLGAALYRLGETDRALGCFKRADEAAANSSAEERTSARVGWARCLFHLGEVREALHLLESHLAELRKADPPDPTSLLQVYAALIPPYFATGLMAKAKDVANLGWQLAPEVPDLDQRACLYVNRAGLLLTQGEPREALASLALAEDLFKQLGWHGEAVKVALARSHALIENGELESAERLVREVLDESTGAVTMSDRAQALVHLSQLRRSAGDAKEGLLLATDVIELAGDSLPTLAAEAQREAGLSASALGDYTGALAFWRKALEQFRQVDMKEDIAKTARLIGDFLMEDGDAAEAAAAYRQGLAAMGELR